MSTVTAPELQGQSSSNARVFELPDHDLDALRSAPPIDHARLLRQCCNDKSFVLMMLDEFAKTSQSRLDAFDAALADHDQVAIASHAHALLGVAGILGAGALTEICSNLQSAVSNADNIGLIGELIRQLHDEVGRIIEYRPLHAPSG